MLHRQALVALCTLTLLVDGRAHAALGEVLRPGSGSTTSTNSTAVLASKNAVQRAAGGSWSRQQTTLESGTLLQEFANAEGIVFAVRWQGPVLPDLPALLGTYFPHFALAAQTMREARRFGPLRIEEAGLVLQSGGRMRNFSGYAYIPSLMPAGVSIDALLP